jgi:amphi-Trp domain-containing protein
VSHGPGGPWYASAEHENLEETGVARRRKTKRDVEKDYPPRRLAAKLRRLADAIEQGQRFRIQIAGERVSVPPNATANIEHERSASQEEIEFQLVWSLED